MKLLSFRRVLQLELWFLRRLWLLCKAMFCHLYKCKRWPVFKCGSAHAVFMWMLILEVRYENCSVNPLSFYFMNYAHKFRYPSQLFHNFVHFFSVSCYFTNLLFSVILIKSESKFSVVPKICGIHEILVITAYWSY